MAAFKRRMAGKKKSTSKKTRTTGMLGAKRKEKATRRKYGM